MNELPNSNTPSIPEFHVQVRRKASHPPHRNRDMDGNVRSDGRMAEKEGLRTEPLVNGYGIALQASDNAPQTSRNAEGMPQVGLAVIGTPGSGKSTFVQHALDLKKCSKGSPSTKKVSLEGVVSLLHIHEFNIFDIDITPEGLPQWPHMLGQDTPSQIDGAMIVYSISDASSTSPIPRLLPRLPRRPNRPRASTNIERFDSALICTASGSKSKHQCVHSDFPPKSDHTQQGSPPKHEGEAERKSNGAGTDQDPDSPPPTMNEILQPGTWDAISNGPVQSAVAQGQESTNLLDPVDGGILTWQDEDDGPRHALDSQNELALKSDTIEMPTTGHGETGLEFEELVDRLLSQAMSKTDVRFVAIFLCLYREFAAPSILLAALISRFGDVNGGKDPSAIRTAAQLRYLSVLAQWIYHYPGDFAHPVTRVIVADFVSGLAGQRAFALVIKEINIYLDVVSEDDDTAWACSDMMRSRTNTMETFQSISSAHNTPSTSRVHTAIENVDSKDYLREKALHDSERCSATPSSASIGKTSKHSNGIVQGLSTTVDSGQGQARLLTPFPRTSLSKAHWHLFMRLSDEDIAQGLTRIDWIMFSSIRPRDLVRYVSLCEMEKEKCKSMENVTRLIHQFNHVAFWIANIILLRDKPKHRAKALEKCMAIAWRLRQLNNYNSLGAVVAGINGTAVHRLHETRELVPHHVQKQFMRLEILMSTQKSHFAYRLAWSNTSTERIPFLPLHTRDLASAEEGNPTYLGEESKRINWKKFEIIGDVIMSIQRSQATPYTNISRSEEVQRIILECKFTRDEDVSTVLERIVNYPG
ncbi:MAG: hypothetical protein Q9224_002513 [Gallowayella concinna]